MKQNFYLEPDGDNEEITDAPQDGDVGGSAPDDPDAEV